MVIDEQSHHSRTYAKIELFLCSLNFALWSFFNSVDQILLNIDQHTLKFIYSEKATKCCEISTLLLTGTIQDKSKVEILQCFVAFSEYMNFTLVNKFLNCIPLTSSVPPTQIVLLTQFVNDHFILLHSSCTKMMMLKLLKCLLSLLYYYEEGNFRFSNFLNKRPELGELKMIMTSFSQDRIFLFHSETSITGLNPWLLIYS